VRPLLDRLLSNLPPRAARRSRVPSAPSDPEPLELRPVPEIDLTRPPRPLHVYARGLTHSLLKRQGVLTGDGRDAPALAVRVCGVRIDPSVLARFRDVCRYFAPPESLPLSYPETLFNSLMGGLVTSADFPLSPMGLIHMAQRIVLRAPIAPSERLDLSCRVAAMRRAARGIEVDVGMQVRVASELRWEGTATLLSRAPGVRGGKSEARRAQEPPLRDPAVETLEVAEWTGRAYARASGDYNPHHLHRITARPVGFSKPIAHGMWTLSRALGAIETRLALPLGVEVEASFKRPLPMPGRVVLRHEAALDGGELRFEVRDAASGAPHVLGLVRAPVG
jgi:acyl dehydratase